MHVSGTLASTLLLGDVCNQAGAAHLEELDQTRRTAWQIKTGMEATRHVRRQERARVARRLNRAESQIAAAAIGIVAMEQTAEDAMTVDDKRDVLRQRWMRWQMLVRHFEACTAALQVLDTQIAIWRATLAETQGVYDRAYNFERVYQSIVRHRERYSGFLEVTASDDQVIVEYGGDDPEKDHHCGRAVFKDGKLIEWSPPFWQHSCQL